jgi:hypothetical protein
MKRSPCVSVIRVTESKGSLPTKSSSVLKTSLSEPHGQVVVFNHMWGCCVMRREKFYMQGGCAI